MKVPTTVHSRIAKILQNHNHRGVCSSETRDEVLEAMQRPSDGCFEAVAMVRKLFNNARISEGEGMVLLGVDRLTFREIMQEIAR